MTYQSMSYCMCENAQQELSSMLARLHPGSLSDDELLAATKLLATAAELIGVHGDDILKHAKDLDPELAASTRATVRDLLGDNAI